MQQNTKHLIVSVGYSDKPKHTKVNAIVMNTSTILTRMISNRKLPEPPPEPLEPPNPKLKNLHCHNAKKNHLTYRSKFKEMFQTIFVMELFEIELVRNWHILPFVAIFIVSIFVIKCKFIDGWCFGFRIIGC